MIKKLRADVLLLCSAASGAKGDQRGTPGDVAVGPTWHGQKHDTLILYVCVSLLPGRVGSDK